MVAATVDSRNHISDGASGTFVGDGTNAKIQLGFNPGKIIVVNETDGIVWSKLKDMAAANSVKVIAAGTQTIDTGSAILFNGDGTVTLSGTGIGVAAKKIVWYAER